MLSAGFPNLAHHWGNVKKYWNKFSLREFYKLISRERIEDSPIESSTVSTTAMEAKYHDRVMCRLWDWTITWTRKHSSRMHTACSPTIHAPLVSHQMHCRDLKRTSFNRPLVFRPDITSRAGQGQGTCPCTEGAGAWAGEGRGIVVPVWWDPRHHG